jgi:DNA repair exonuclease SbcCD nuclease subunit
LRFTFLHAADLHLGSPFKGLASRDETLARRFAEASRRAFVELIDRALAEPVAFAVIAGDIYDGEWKDMAIGHFFNREISRLDRAGIPVFLIKGNHDAASEVTKTLPLPQSVTTFSDTKPETRRIEALRVALHGRSFRDRVVSENFARTYPAPVDGWFNIGILHTSLAGNPKHETYAPCSLDDLATRGYDYWALGHVHDFDIVATNPHVVFPGNLQGRSVRETGAKGAVFVDVEDGRITDIRRVIVDQARFADMRVDVSDAMTEADVTARMRDSFASLDADADGRLLAVRVRLTGTAPLHTLLIAQRAQIAENAQSALHHVHEDAWLEKCLIETREPEADRPRDPTAALIDPATLLEGLEHDEDMRVAAREIVEEIAAQWPVSSEFEKEAVLAELDHLLDEARALVLARALGPASRFAPEA